MTPDQQKLFALLFRPAELTDDELRQLRGLISVDSRDHIQGMAMIRASLDNIAAIRKFDKASAELVSTTNKLTEKIVRLTYVMLGIGLLNALASGWTPFTWWLTHGFRFH